MNQQHNFTWCFSMLLDAEAIVIRLYIFASDKQEQF